MRELESPQSLNVLLVEDNDDDVLLTRRAFKKTEAAVDLQVACDGVEALAMLRNEEPRHGFKRPDVILLDLNMPRMDGRDLLLELKSDDRLTTIPAVVLTTSEADDDLAVAYRRHASAYLTKPIELDCFDRRIRRFVDYWLGEVTVLR